MASTDANPHLRVPENRNRTKGPSLNVKEILTVGKRLCYNDTVVASATPNTTLHTQSRGQPQIVPTHSHPVLVYLVVRIDKQLLRVNVGFLLKEGAGYSRTIHFEQAEPFQVQDVVYRQLDGDLRLTRTPQGVLAQGTLVATLDVECVRCLTEIEHPFEITFDELFVLPSDPEADDPENLYSIDEGSSIDLGPILREEGILAVPMQVLCKRDCQGLCVQCGQNLNEAVCDCEQEMIDPRLASLRELLEG